MTHKFCTHCGKQNKITAKVCIECGQAFRTRSAVGKACPQCGAVSQLKAKVCRICGYRYEIALPPQPPEPPLAQPVAAGVSLPPPAEIPPLPTAPAAENTPPAARPPLERFGGKTGVLLTPEELERLRQVKPEQKVYLVNRTPRKKGR